MKTSINIVNGQIIYNSELHAFLKTLPNNSIVEITLELKGSKRKKDHNAYYWKLLEQISNVIGETKDKCHDLMVYKFLGPKSYVIEGIEITKLPSTSNLSTKEFTEYVENVKRWAVEFLNLIV